MFWVVENERVQMSAARLQCAFVAATVESTQPGLATSLEPQATRTAAQRLRGAMQDCQAALVKNVCALLAGFTKTHAKPFDAVCGVVLQFHHVFQEICLGAILKA